MSKDDTMTTVEVAALIRVSYRQLDYWVRNGYLIVNGSKPGSGFARHFTPDDVLRARAFGAMLHAGVVPSALAGVDVLVDDSWFAAQLGALTVSGPLP
jgi:hypothetical protein